MGAPLRRRRSLLCAIAAACASRAAAVDLGKTTYNLNFIVESGRETYDGALRDAEALLKEAVDKKMGTAVQLLLRSASDKVRRSLLELDAKIEKQGAVAKPAGPPTVLANASVGVRPLKSTWAKPKKANAIKRVTLAEFEAEVASGKAAKLLARPLVVEGGVAALDDMRTALSAEALMAPELAHVKLEYFTPAVSKQKRSFEEGQAPQEWEHTEITFERFFVNCFNLKAKPDFRKRGGGQTEHCEQDLGWATVFGANATNLLATSLASAAGAGLDADRGRTRLLLDMERRGIEAATDAMTRATTRLVVGPAGSGEHLRQQRTPLVDGLAHGERRWFTMAPDAFQVLRSKAEAAETLEPSSAFVFFESQLEELIEDLELGSSKLRYKEGTQRPGDVVFVPPQTIFTHLTYADAVSVRGLASSAADAADAVDARLWAPHLGAIPDNVAAAACYGDRGGGGQLFDARGAQDAVRAGMAHPPIRDPQGDQIVAMTNSILPQIFPSEKHRDGLAAGALADCAGYRAVAGFLDGSQCLQHARPCARALGVEDADWMAPVLA